MIRDLRSDLIEWKKSICRSSFSFSGTPARTHFVPTLPGLCAFVLWKREAKIRAGGERRHIHVFKCVYVPKFRVPAPEEGSDLKIAHERFTEKKDVGTPRETHKQDRDEEREGTASGLDHRRYIRVLYVAEPLPPTKARFQEDKSIANAHHARSRVRARLVGRRPYRYSGHAHFCSHFFQSDMAGEYEA